MTRVSQCICKTSDIIEQEAIKHYVAFKTPRLNLCVHVTLPCKCGSISNSIRSRSNFRGLATHGRCKPQIPKLSKRGPVITITFSPSMTGNPKPLKTLKQRRLDYTTQKIGTLRHSILKTSAIDRPLLPSSTHFSQYIWLSFTSNLCATWNLLHVRGH